MGLLRATPADYQQELGKSRAKTPAKNGLTLTGIDIAFWDLVKFLIKLSLAMIPAGIILALFAAFIWGTFIGAIIGK